VIEHGETAEKCPCCGGEMEQAVMVWDGNEYREVEKKGEMWVDVETGAVVEMPESTG